MTEIEKIELVKSICTGESEEVVSSYLRLAGRAIINRAYPYNHTVTEVPMQYESLQCEIAVYLLNKRGAEGQTAHTENGIARRYEGGNIPPSLLAEVTPHVGTIGGVKK